VKGQHEPIIDKTLFYEVQDFLNRNKRPISPKGTSVDMLPFRGFLQCPTCHRLLTGSGSKGRSDRYYYYHCSSNVCKARFRAIDVNGYFENELLRYKLLPGAGELFKMVVMDQYRSNHREELDSRAEIAKKIEEFESMLSNARRKLMKDQIDDQDFAITKKECNEELKKLEDRLNELPAKSQNSKTIESLLDIVIERYVNIDERYENADIEEKRTIIGSMYPEKIDFLGNEHRTARMSESLQLILQINSKLQAIKKGESSLKLNLSPHVDLRGSITEKFLPDLRRLAWSLKPAETIKRQF